MKRNGRSLIPGNMTPDESFEMLCEKRMPPQAAQSLP
jgi:hypothetical protein